MLLDSIRRHFRESSFSKSNMVVDTINRIAYEKYGDIMLNAGGDEVFSGRDSTRFRYCNLESALLSVDRTEVVNYFHQIMGG